MQAILLQQADANVFHLESLKERFVFHGFNYILKYKLDMFRFHITQAGYISFSYNTLSAIVELIFSSFTQSCSSDKKLFHIKYNYL